ncbi:MAG TPA: hypothetical protein VN699_02860 [Pirellulales bacterium]|nr:hypothetical protein [Pirellulales bacterium]
MDENPYKAPAESSASNQKTARPHPMLDPLWSRATWAVLMFPFLIVIAAALILAIFG